MSVLIIAEAGVNHNGNIDLACRLVDAAKNCGADCIKFQTFISRNLVSRFAPKAEYQKENTCGNNSQLEMIKKLELSFRDFTYLKSYCDKAGIVFLSTPFDLESINFLNSIDIPFWKIASGEITNLPFLVKIAETRKPVIMSTGMCEVNEIEKALTVLKSNGTHGIKLLHCNTEYPTPFSDVNLRAMVFMHKHFNVEVGYSDHTKGIEVPIAAVALGATVIEKHITLNCKMEGPDHKASIEPAEFSAMVSSIRHIEEALGDGMKTVSLSERKNLIIARKSIVARRRIKAGELFSEENLTVKRPGNGICPMRWYDVIGLISKRDFSEDELIEI